MTWLGNLLNPIPHSIKKRFWDLWILLNHLCRDERVRFLVIGAINTGIGYFSFAALYVTLGTWLHYLVIAALAHVVSVIEAFLLQRRLVFQSTKPWFPEFFRYNISVLSVLAGSMAFLSLLVSGIGLNPLLAQAIVTAGSAVAAYISHRRFSFKCS